MKHDVSKVKEVRQALAQGVGITDPCGQAQEGGMNYYSIRRWVFVSLLGRCPRKHPPDSSISRCPGGAIRR
jgi:hypothetical protein